MVKSRRKNNRKRGQKQGENKEQGKVRKIKASTRHGYTDDYLSPYGGLLPLVKLWDALKFEELFKEVFIEPGRKTEYGSLFFVKGLLVLLFIGFCRVNHFVYIDGDPYFSQEDASSFRS